MKRKIGIVGAGPAGMTAAIAAAERGADVTLFEQKERVGNKILVTGNGKCNLTNTNLKAEFYHGKHSEFAETILRRFSLRETIAFFTQIGIYTKNRNGGLYPHSEQASAVLDALRMELRRLNVNIQNNRRITEIRRDDTNGFIVKDSEGREEVFSRVILAAGSKASPKTGSDGSGYKLAKKMQISIIKPLPALTQLRSCEHWFKGVSGVRCDAWLRLYANGEEIAEERGELQLTDYGISGIPVFQLSGRAARALDQGFETVVKIHFLPEFEGMQDKSYLSDFIADRFKNKDKTCEEALIGLFHKKLIAFFLREAGIRPQSPCDSLTQEKLLSLLEVITQCRVPIDRVNSFEHAQTCTGGIDTAELDGNLQVKKIPGLYVAGEIMDIDGACGGYNLQWAWSTGQIAGACAADD